MRTRTQRWWLAGGLVLALLSGGSALQTGHGSQLQAGYGIGGKTIAGYGIGGKTIAGVIWGTQPAVVHPHTPTRDGFGISG